jgi:hypothetical protein
MYTKVRVGNKGWLRPLACLDAIMRLNVSIYFVCQSCSPRGKVRCGEGGAPSRTLNPILDQSMVLTGGGGKAIL